MIIYETADGTLWWPDALQKQVIADAEAAWDVETQGPKPWSGRRFSWYRDWLIEAIQTGVIKERVVKEARNL